MRNPLVQKMFSGDVDIIGDIHGEYGALLTLLDRLGYDEQGNHRLNRKLVFVGDLVDRGPDSLSVVKLVATMHRAGNAQVVAGNHELNLLRKKRKHGNHWFYGEKEKLFGEDDVKAYGLSLDSSFSRLVSDSETQAQILDFFQQLPIALERKDLRVVHACWHQPSIDQIRNLRENLKTYYQQTEDQLRAIMSPPPKGSDPQRSAMYDLFMQNNHPIKVLTSGPEIRAQTPFQSGGKLRYTERVLWWETYTEPIPVIFGHYWRRRGSPPYDLRKSPPPYLFSEIPEFGWYNHTFCIDYSVGGRYMERATQKTLGSMGAYLCAFRTHGNTYSLLFDDGLAVNIPSPHPS